MPPKKSTRATKSIQDPAPVSPAKKADEEPKTRTRGRKLDSPAAQDAKPTKKVKKDESDDEDVKKSKTEPKKTKSGDLSASKEKKLATVAEPPAKQPAKQSAKQPAPQELKKVILKGGAPVDQLFFNTTQYRVYSDAGKTYSATLNQSNVSANNNKFYILQILQNQTVANDFYFFTRWGRVGVPGQQASIPSGNVGSAIYMFNKKYREKVNGGYREVQMNYEDDKEAEKEKEKKQRVKPKDNNNQTPEVQSNLDDSVQDLIKLIFDMKMMSNAMKQIGYDAKKMPLGKLAKSSILRGYEALKGLMDELKGQKRRPVIQKLSSDFYSQIPHDFGFQRMQNFVLDTEVKVKTKLEMLQSLEDIQIFTKLLDQGNISNVNELDSNYLKLNTTVTPLEKNSETYKLLVEYVENTHATTHTAFKLQVLEIFELSKQVQEKRYRKDIDNKQLLWHGSRLTNFVGILSQGLRIAPPEAPVTGYMFGKGVYFADMVTKSANYCFTSRQSNTGLMMLCEVALGGVNEKYYADYYASNLPPGKHSTKGCGKTAPSSGKMLDGVFVPCGVGAPTGHASTSLLYNEFIVYDIAQIRSRFLFRMKFNYR